MRLVKEELGDGRVGVGMTGAEQEENEEVDENEEKEGEDEEVVVAVLPRMSSM